MFDFLYFALLTFKIQRLIKYIKVAKTILYTHTTRLSKTQEVVRLRLKSGNFDFTL